MDTVDTNYLAGLVIQEKRFFAENAVEFNSLDEMGTKHEELNLGDIMSDAYIMLSKIQSILMEIR